MNSNSPSSDMKNSVISSVNGSFDEYIFGDSCPPLSQFSFNEIDMGFQLDGLVDPETQFEEESFSQIYKRKVRGGLFSKRIKTYVEKKKQDETNLVVSAHVNQELHAHLGNGVFTNSFVEEIQLDYVVEKEIDGRSNVGKEKEKDDNPFLWSDIYEDSQPDEFDESFVEETQFDSKGVMENMETDNEFHHPHQKVINEMLRILLPSYKIPPSKVNNKKIWED